MDNVPPAVELGQLDHALARLDAERSRLLARRAHLLTELHRTAPPGGHPPAWGPPRPPERPGREAGPWTVQSVLLALGGVLLAVAVTAFTVISWGHLGIAGRSAVLGALTLAALGAPVLLLRRALRATAEVVAALGLVLLTLDAYALHEVALPETGGVGYAAGATAVLALAWAAYGWWLRSLPVPGRAAGSGAAGLALPYPAAVVLAQAPLVLWAWAAAAPAAGFAAALLATAVLGTVVIVLPVGKGVRITAAVCLAVVTAVGLLVTAWVSWAGSDLASATRAAALLVTVTAAGLVLAARPAAGTPPLARVTAAALPAWLGCALAAWPHSTAGAVALLPAGLAAAAALRTAAPSAAGDEAEKSGAATAQRPAGAWLTRGVPAVVGGTALVAAVGGLPRVALTGAWDVLGYLLAATALLGTVALAAHRHPPARRTFTVRGLAAAAAGVHAAAVAWTAPTVTVVLLAPVSWADAVWSGAPEGARQALGHDLPQLVLDTLAVPAVLGVVAAVLFAARRSAPVRGWAPALSCVALVLGAAATTVLPVILDLPYPVAVSLLLAQVVVWLVASAVPLPRPVARTALWTALAIAVTAAFWGLADRPVTFWVFGALTVAFAAASVTGEDRVRQPVAAAATVVCVTALAVAGPAAAGLPSHQAAYGVLAVAAATTGAAARLRGHSAGLAVEYAGGAAAALAVGLAVGDAPSLATVLALAGVVAAGTALRADRRRYATRTAAALFVLATWVRLGASGVSTPEAYTLPVSLLALYVGLRRRAADRDASSWVAYGPGLSATLLPSLLAAWGDGHWLRPLLLGLAALGVTLAGARWRLQAPLLSGGAVLALVALHELAPYIVQVVDAVPRWLPPAAAGLLLLGVGTTYEQRLRDARRLRDALGRLH